MVDLLGFFLIAEVGDTRFGPSGVHGNGPDDATFGTEKWAESAHGAQCEMDNGAQF